MSDYENIPLSELRQRLNRACRIASTINVEKAYAFGNDLLGMYPDVLAIYLPEKGPVDKETLSKAIEQLRELEISNHKWASFCFPEGATKEQRIKLWYSDQEAKYVTTRLAPFPGDRLFQLKATHGLPLDVAIEEIYAKKCLIEWPSFIEEARKNKWYDFQTMEVLEAALIDANVDPQKRAGILTRCKQYIVDNKLTTH